MSGGVVLLVLGLLVCVDMGHTVEVFDSPMPSHVSPAALQKQAAS